jgi:hypothetical protein
VHERGAAAIHGRSGGEGTLPRIPSRARKETITRKLILLSLVLVASSAIRPALAQQVLTNTDVIKMVKAKLSDAVIIAEIHKSPCKFSTAPDDLIVLKQAGVSDVVIAAMTDPGPTPNGPAAHATQGPARDVGAYYHHRGSWDIVPPEVVNWKTGGVLKSHFTLGVVKGDINGMIHGGRSQTGVTMPATFLIVVPEGAYITEYQLIHLHGHGHSREFRTVTGGVFHASGGATRDVLSFQSKAVLDRTFQVTLSGLKKGEYGFLPAAASPTRQQMSTAGAMYTFHVVE